MRKDVQRMFVKTTIKACKVAYENGKPVALPLDNITTWGVVKEDEAHRIVKKTYGAGAVFAGMESEEKHYKISVEKFIENAEEITAEEANEIEKEEVK